MGLLERVATNKYYNSNQLEWILKIIGNKFIKSNKKIEYLNIPICFDIETSSYETAPSENRVGIMYGWTLSIYGYVILGRTWEDFLDVLKRIEVFYSLIPESRRIMIYVHNLSYEFQFMRKRLKWFKIFALEQREVVEAITTGGVEFRCSYKLSGYSLANLSNQLVKYKTQKMIGDLDYNLIRTPITPLTEKEIGYMVHDVNVVVAYIQELIEREGNITLLPLTKTGFVRRLCRHSCLYDKTKKNSYKYFRYRGLMTELQLTSETYTVLKKAYMGGYTHANAFFVQEKLKNVGSFDLTSAYPAHMLTEYYPMSKFLKVNIEDSNQLEKFLINRCCLLKIKFYNIYAKFEYENYISLSKCYNVKNPVLNNGRVFSAEELTTYITELDYFTIKETYQWEDAEIIDFYIADKGYLPTDLIKAMLQLYKNKTELKDVEGKEVEYMQSKEYINSMYGMMVTDPLRDEILYDEYNNWNKEKPEIEEGLYRYNISKNRFLYYAWGVWITAYTRRTLWHAIQNLGEDYVYSDTDSVKFINKSNHLDFFRII